MRHEDNNLKATEKNRPPVYAYGQDEDYKIGVEPIQNIRQNDNDHHHVVSNVNFTSGHSKLFGISIEDAEHMRSTTQSALYNTKVSPTLPMWRDGDDVTTNRYPVNYATDSKYERRKS